LVLIVIINCLIIKRAPNRAIDSIFLKHVLVRYWG
jgi:hypothetical protein